MSRLDVRHTGGCVEHWMVEAGAVWLQRLTTHFRRSAWLNPLPERGWDHAMSVAMIRQAMERRMFPLTLGGIDAMARELSK
jgi:uncharacterized protein with von Willebrand factor type A (vWA) domain